MTNSTGMWLLFSIFMMVALSIDAFFLNRKWTRPHESMSAAIGWTILWIFSALIFCFILWIYFYQTESRVIANENSLAFLTGYLIEKTLSFDNLFAFYVIFQYFHIPLVAQQRVFAYGILSAIVMRLIIILIGIALIAEFHWLLYVMGAFLLLTGLKMFFNNEKHKDLANTWIMQGASKILRMTSSLHGEHFFIRQQGLWYVTPLLLALIFVEISDLIFAVDSIPAIFAVTRDPFIVWTSNIFAILGLRALYFLLANMMMQFHLVKYGVALILIFIGVKMLCAPFILLPISVTLLTVFTILIFFVWLSFARAKKSE